MLINLSLSCSPVNKGVESQLIISVICNEEVKESGVSVSKGIHTLIDASKEIKGTNHIYFSNINKIKVHNKFRENYTGPCNIKVAALKARCAEPSTSQHYLREVEDRFDFKRDCLLCKKYAVYDPKYPSKYRTQIHEVSTIEINQTIIEACDDRNDEWGCIVKARLLDVIDLVAAEARYQRFLIT